MRRWDWLESRSRTSRRGVERRRRLVGLGLADATGSGRTARRARRCRGRPLEVADDERAAARRRPPPRAERDDAVARERVADVLGGTEHGPAERVIAERRLVDQVLGDHRRLVVGARDLLDDDAALAVELLGVDPRASDEVGQQVGRLAARARRAR